MFKVGQEVYTIDVWDNSVEKVKITSINIKDNTADLKWKYGSNTQPLNTLFETEKEAIENKNKKIEDEHAYTKIILLKNVEKI